MNLLMTTVFTITFSTFMFVSNFPIRLPIEVKRMLELINFKFNEIDQDFPFYFALYTEVNRHGWDTAEEELMQNLNKLLEAVQEDEYLKDREGIVRRLLKGIQAIEVGLDFYSEEFFLEHKNNYLRTVKNLCRTKKPDSYRNFRYSRIKDLRLKEAGKVAKRKITISDEETREQYKTYLQNFEKQSINPNHRYYKQLYKKVNPRYLKRNSIIEVYQYFNSDLKLVYENREGDKQDYDIRDLCVRSSSGLFSSSKFTPYKYIAVPISLPEVGKEMKVLSGGQFAALAGNCGVDNYQWKDNKYCFNKRFVHWQA